MTILKTLAAATALTLLAGGAAFADGMKSDAMMKADAAQMQKCKAMGDKAKTDPKCMALMKKTDAMKADPMKGDPMKGDSMKADHH